MYMYMYMYTYIIILLINNYPLNLKNILQKYMCLHVYANSLQNWAIVSNTCIFNRDSIEANVM